MTLQACDVKGKEEKSGPENLLAEPWTRDGEWWTCGVLVSGNGHWRPCGTTLCSLKLSGRAVFTAGVLQLVSVVPEPFV